MRGNTTVRWFTLAVISLGMGGAFAFLVGMSRMPVISNFFPKNYFEHALVGHVDLAILCWLLLSAIVLWNYRFRGSGSFLGFWLAVSGVALITLSALTGAGEAVLNNYVPAIIHPVFFTGLALLFAGFSVNVFAHLKEVPDGINSDDMVTNALSTALVIAVIMIAAMLLSLVLPGGSGLNPQLYYERLFWTPGHIQQILNGSMLLATWYLLAGITAEREIRHWGILKGANKVLVVSALILMSLMFVLDPLSRPMRIGSEIVYAVGLGIPLFLHIANIFRQYEFRAGKPASVALIFSMTIYLFGIFIAYAGFSNDTRVPAHYHGAVTALTLALMGFAYHMLSSFGIRLFFQKVAKLQPYLYGVGMLLFISGLFVSGLFGAPRKTHGVDWTDNPIIIASMTLMGVGTMLAVVAGALFVFYIAVSLLKNETVER